MARLLSWLDATLAALGDGFIRAWTRVERSYKRPAARMALRLRFAFYPLLALGAIAWLAWDWYGARSLNSAENAIFDRVVQWRPYEPKPSGRVVVVEIDECSIDHFRAQGEGGWPWSRQRHADLLDALDRAGALTIGYDVLFSDATEDTAGDRALEAMAAGGEGRFVFASTRLHPDYDEGSPLRASQAPAAFALAPGMPEAPKLALLLPYGAAMARSSALVNVTRNVDGVLRDIPLRETVGGWAIPSLPLRLAMNDSARAPQEFPAAVRPNWRLKSRLPRTSAADLLAAERALCREAGTKPPALKDAIVLVGYTAAGLSDAKPTPVDPVMPGVEVLAEATEALVAGSAIRAPPTWVKYVLAAFMVVLTAFAFFRGEPATDIDSVFVATNLALLTGAFIGLTCFGYFFDIFASVGFISLVFGLCRLYAGVQRGHAVGNGDYRQDYDPAKDRWLAVARLRFVPDPGLDRRQIRRRRREYRRRVRRFLYAGTRAVMLEGVVERKSWLHDTLSDLTVLIWSGASERAARDAAIGELAMLDRQLAEYDARLPDDGTVRLAFACAEIAPGAGEAEELIGRVLASTIEQPLARREPVPAGDMPGGS
ncbi:MAG: CHASE2 domain-containing protein [Gammaproteobacteria bacterium]